jgi:hypothetical protein
MNSIFENLKVDNSFEERLGHLRCDECGYIATHARYICSKACD